MSALTPNQALSWARGEHVNDELSQLRSFAEWERTHNPHPEGRQHVAEWAVREIERLRAAPAEPAQGMRELHNAVHEAMDLMLQEGVPMDAKHPRRLVYERLRAALAEPVQEPEGIAAAYRRWVDESHAPLLRRADAEGAFAAGWQAALAEPVQEVVAWFVMRQAPGYRDHGMKLGPFWKRSDAEEWLDDRHTLHPLCAPSLRPAEPVQEHFRDATKMVQEPVDLPPPPTDVLSLHGPIWSRILDWNDASIGEEAVRAADEITRVIQEQMQAYARTAVAAQSRPAEPQEPTGCAHCTHPLYAGVKCGSCGRVRA
jgi:hypothetical protein